MLNIVLVQHAHDTGRYHPAHYSYAPMPGPGPDPVLRYRSRSHHTVGFETLEEAEEHGRELAAQLGGRFVAEAGQEVAEVGPGHVLLPPTLFKTAS